MALSGHPVLIFFFAVAPGGLSGLLLGEDEPAKSAARKAEQEKKEGVRQPQGQEILPIRCIQRKDTGGTGPREWWERGRKKLGTR